MATITNPAPVFFTRGSYLPGLTDLAVELEAIRQRAEIEEELLKIKLRHRGWLALAQLSPQSVVAGVAAERTENFHFPAKGTDSALVNGPLVHYRNVGESEPAVTSSPVFNFNLAAGVTADAVTTKLSSVLKPGSPSAPPLDDALLTASAPEELRPSEGAGGRLSSEEHNRFPKGRW